MPVVRLKQRAKWNELMLTSLASVSIVRSSDKLFAMWTTGVDHRGVTAMIERMGTVSAEMWQRGGREIAAGFARHPVPWATTPKRPPMHCGTP